MEIVNILGIIAVLNTALVQLIKTGLAKIGAVELPVWAVKGISWASPLIATFALAHLGVITGGWILWGVLAALASNGIYDIKKLWA